MTDREGPDRAIEDDAGFSDADPGVDEVTRGGDGGSVGTPSASSESSGGDATTQSRKGGSPKVTDVLAEESLGEPRRLDGSVRLQWVVGSTFGALFGSLATTVVFRIVGGRIGFETTGSLPLGFGRLSVAVGLGALALFLALATLRAVLLYRSWRYEVRSDSLYLTRGVLTRVQTVAPYVRVQHIDTRRSPVERLLGLSSLVVYTAGSRGADVTVPGLTDDRAAELQSRLKRLAIATEEEEDAV